MIDDQDRYEAYYAEKLWNLLPAVYREQDTDQFDSAGPLRELVNRIGAQAAVLRRSLDRMWDDQSIETCDDWIIPYLGDLLATNLVTRLDARGQRLDVFKTVRYRRRKGTVAILEEMAFDITGWNAKIVEFFRRLGRTRHGLDPAIGQANGRNDNIATLQHAEGLVGVRTRTPIGGFADLRNNYGASKAHSAFDEFFYTSDFRVGRGQVGWHNIPRIGVFLWRLTSFPVQFSTPVAQAPVEGHDCTGWFTFDPTGRDIPLYAKPRAMDSFSKDWISPDENQLPTPISQQMFDAQPTDYYPNSLAVLPKPGDSTTPLTSLTIRPKYGRFKLDGAPPPALCTKYCYGYSSSIGAGPYDRRLDRALVSTPAPPSQKTGGGSLDTLPFTGTVTIGDSLTYATVNDFTIKGPLTISAGIGQRPVLRLETTWTITGKAKTTNCLLLDGLLISGADVVLKGEFDCVTITCCTLDPGTSDGIAADGRPLVPSHLRIEGMIGTLTIERSIMAPISANVNGKIQTLTITDSIVQALPSGGMPNSAIALDDGDVSLTRCTILGPMSVHRLNASDCILRGHVTVDDVQHGCVRFSAWETKSVLPRQYESVRIGRDAKLFTTEDFGTPEYCQLLDAVDSLIDPTLGPPPPTPPTIAAGAENGAEMGVFAREMNSLKERGLLLKFQEFMPAGLVPVLIYVT